jgi:hypothetical protein
MFKFWRDMEWFYVHISNTNTITITIGIRLIPALYGNALSAVRKELEW